MILKGMRSHNIVSRIVPGDNTTILRPPHSHPWVVGLPCQDIDSNEIIACGGTLIGEHQKYVLTAAHCIDGEIGEYVVVGEHDLNDPNDGQEKIKVINKIFHPEWTPPPDYDGRDYDLAILELEKGVTNPFAKSALLPHEGDRFEKYIVDGWGDTCGGEIGSCPSHILRTIVLSDIQPNNDKPGAGKECALDANYDLHICGMNLTNPIMQTGRGDSGGIL